MKIRVILLVLSVIALHVNGQHKSPTATLKITQGMVKVTILYPNGEGKVFDMDYYSNKHMPMVARLLGNSLRYFEIDKGVSGRTPDEAIQYLAIGHLYFDKLSAYHESFGPNTEQIVGDIPNYTNIQPILQINDVFQ